MKDFFMTLSNSWYKVSATQDIFYIDLVDQYSSNGFPTQRTAELDTIETMSGPGWTIGFSYDPNRQYEVGEPKLNLTARAPSHLWYDGYWSSDSMGGFVLTGAYYSLITYQITEVINGQDVNGWEQPIIPAR